MHIVAAEIVRQSLCYRCSWSSIDRHSFLFLETHLLILLLFTAFRLDQIFLKCSVGPRPVNLLTLACLELTGFNGKCSKVGISGDSLFRVYPLPSPFTPLLCDLKLMPKPQWLPCWMLRNFEMGEVWQMAWGFFFFNGSYGEGTSRVTPRRKGSYGFHTRRALAKLSRGQYTGVVNNVLFSDTSHSHYEATRILKSINLLGMMKPFMKSTFLPFLIWKFG